MEPETVDVARRSVVVVAVKKQPKEYSSGCVVVKSKAVQGSRGKRTLVIASAEFVRGRERRLKVVFFDNREQGCTVVAVHGAFCLLSTECHKGCDSIRLFEEKDGLTPSRSFILTPSSPTTNVLAYSYVTVESGEAYGMQPKVLVPTSTNYFTVTCPYFEKTESGANRLIGAPVFGLEGTRDGRTLGIVLQDYQHEPNCPGAEFKVIVTAKHLRLKLNQLLNQLPNPQHQGKSGQKGRSGQKRKRGH